MLGLVINICNSIPHKHVISMDPFKWQYSCPERHLSLSHLHKTTCSSHQTHWSSGLELAWHNCWSRICCSWFEGPPTPNSYLFSSASSALHLTRVTTLAHSSYIHSPSSFLIFWLPIPLPCYLHLVSQHPSLLTRICTLMRRNCEPQLIKLEVQVVIQTVDHYNYS